MPSRKIFGSSRAFLPLLALLLSVPCRGSEALALATPKLADDGGWSGNGGGNYQVSDNVWFLGAAPVSYCLHVGESFPLGSDAASSFVSKALSDWQSFLKFYEIGQPVLMPPLDQLGLNQLPAMSQSFQEVSCDKKPELEFFLGTDNDTIRLFRSMNEPDAYGLAIRRSFDHVSLRNTGYVWISAFTQDQRKLEHMLLHELGHVFGMKHDSVFVMDKDIGVALDSLSADDPAQKFIGDIEADFWPFDLTSFIRLQPFARHLPGDRPPQKDCPKGTVPGSLIPLDFQPKPAGPGEVCFNLLLKKDSVNGSMNMQFVVQGQSSESTLLGTLQTTAVSQENPSGPGTFSTFAQYQSALSSSLTRWLYLPFSKRSTHAQLSGFFVRGPMRYPAKLSWGRGLTLEIFLPQQGRWWSIRSFADSALKPWNG